MRLPPKSALSGSWPCSANWQPISRNGDSSELHVSFNTVKTHVKSIFSQACRHAPRAVSRARELEAARAPESGTSESGYRPVEGYLSGLAFRCLFCN